MTVPAGAPGDDVPEADWAEQEVDAGPSPDADAVPAPEVAASEREADEADVVEQELPVDYDDDERG